MPSQTTGLKLRRRDGTLARFDPARIEKAVLKAAAETLKNRPRAAAIARRISSVVVQRLRDRLKGPSPAGVEDIQDEVESALMKNGYFSVAKSYILYRDQHRRLRDGKILLGIQDDLKLPFNSITVLKSRYLLKDDEGQAVETPSEMFRRVAHHVAQAELNYGPKARAEEAEEVFYRMMRDMEFLPNSPTLMNAGTRLGQLSACFVLPVPDSIKGIFDSLRHMAVIHQSGGGTGFNFSRLRPRNDVVASTKGQASGPVSFMGIYDAATGVIMQGGRRRGANMGILRCDHPDIVDFIEAKNYRQALSNFNLSVGITENFMSAVRQGRDFFLINPRTRKTSGKIKARALFELMVNAAWNTGDPGLIFLDEINRKNPLPGLDEIEATNPCGELPLLPYESCNLASINLARMAAGGCLDWSLLADRVNWAVRFLDDVVDVNRYPLPQVRKITLANRKVGLGVMGFADALILLGIPYGSPRAEAFASKLMGFIRRESLKASGKLAVEREVFPNFDRSVYVGRGIRLRNATVNAIAPTGTISIIAGCSSGIEPLFALSFMRNVLSGERMAEVHQLFQQAAKKGGFYSQKMATRIASLGSARLVKGIPDGVKKLFATAFDLTPLQQLRIQAAFQRHTDNSVSKTINLPATAAAADVRQIFLTAHRLKCKGITVYRYGSRDLQALSFGGKPDQGTGSLTPGSDSNDGCPSGSCW